MIKDTDKTAQINIKKFKGNNTEMHPAMTNYYQWNRPGAFVRGEAQGDALPAKKFMNYYNAVKFQQGGLIPYDYNPYVSAEPPMEDIPFANPIFTGNEPEDYQAFLDYSRTAPQNRRPNQNYFYGDPDNYDHYGMWEALGKPKDFQQALEMNPDWEPDPYDKMYHGFSVNPETGVFLKSGKPGDTKEGDTTWMEIAGHYLSPRANESTPVFDPELQRFKYIPKEVFQKGGTKMSQEEFEKRKAAYKKMTGRDFEPPKSFKQSPQAREYYQNKYNQQPVIQSQPSETTQQSRGVNNANIQQELDNSTREEIEERNRQRIDDSRTYFEADNRSNAQRERDQTAAKQLTDPDWKQQIVNAVQAPLFQAGNFWDYVSGGDDWEKAQQAYNLNQLNPYSQNKMFNFLNTGLSNTGNALITGMEIADGYAIARALPGFGKNLKNFFPTKTPQQLPSLPNAISSVDDVGRQITKEQGFFSKTKNEQRPIFNNKDIVTEETLKDMHKEFDEVLQKNLDRINSEHYIKARQKVTGESIDIIKKDIAQFNKRAKEVEINFNKKSTNRGDYTHAFGKLNRINLYPENLINKKDALQIFDHEVKHMLSPVGLESAKTAYKSYPSVVNTNFFDKINDVIFNSKKAKIKEYVTRKQEQQVRLLQTKELIQKNAGKKIEQEITFSDFKNWLDKQPGKNLSEKLNKTELFEIADLRLLLKS
jgi:predicted lipoprotein